MGKWIETAASQIGSDKLILPYILARNPMINGKFPSNCRHKINDCKNSQIKNSRFSSQPVLFMLHNPFLQRVFNRVPVEGRVI